MSAENITPAPSADAPPVVEATPAEAAVPAPAATGEGSQTNELANFLTSTGPEDYDENESKEKCKRCAAKGKKCQGPLHKIKKALHCCRMKMCSLCHCGKKENEACAAGTDGAAPVAEGEVCDAAAAPEACQEVTMPDATTDPKLDIAATEPAPEKMMTPQDEPVPIAVPEVEPAEVQGPMPADPK